MTPRSGSSSSTPRERSKLMAQRVAPPGHMPAIDPNFEKHRGMPVPDGLRSRAERSLGVSLSHVRLHAGRPRHGLAGRRNAAAATRGEQIALGPKADEETLAHELVHVAQNRIGGASGTGVSNPDDGAEVEARKLAPSVLQGSPVGNIRARPSAAIQLDNGEPKTSQQPSPLDPDPECVDPDLTPSFLADDVDVVGMSNEKLNVEALRVDDWLRSHPPDGATNPDRAEYRKLARLLRSEREKRVWSGHFWMAQATEKMPTVLYQLVGGPTATSVVVADLVKAYGVPEKGLPQPIMTPEQFDRYLTAHGVEKVAADTPRGKEALAVAGGGTPGTGDGSTPGVPPVKGPLLTAPLPPGKPYPYGTAAEGFVAAVYYPDAVTLPRAYPAYDAFTGGTSTFSLGFEGPKANRYGVVTQTVTGGEWISIKTLLGPEYATPAHMESVVNGALDNIANKTGGKMDVGEVAPGMRWRMGPANPDIAVIHIVVPEEATNKVPQLQAAADRKIQTTNYGPDMPAQIRASVTPWQSRPPGSPEATPGPVRPFVPGVGEVPMAAGTSGVIALFVSGGIMLVDARDHPDWAEELAKQGGSGVVSGGTQQGIERLVATKGGTFLPGASGAALRTLGRRLGAGATSFAFETYDVLTEPGYHSTAEQVVRPVRAGAIGLTSGELGFAAGAATVAPATAGAVFVMSAAGYGAAAGSVAPVVGTAIGFVVGLAVGLAAYAILDAAVPGGKDSWDHNQPQLAKSGIGKAFTTTLDPLIADMRAEQALHEKGAPYAAGISDAGMPIGFGLREEERDTCIQP